jgi:peptidoglycan DL-endopeptidase CwlO
VLAALAVVGTDLAYAPAAAAPGDPVTAEEAASLVAERGHQLEVLTEEFNEARETLEEHQAAAAAAEGEVAEAEAGLAALSDQLADVAQTAYTGDALGALQGFISSGSPEESLDRVSLLESIASHRGDVIDQVAAARDTADEARVSAERAVAEAQQQITRSSLSRQTYSRRSPSTRLSTPP